MAPDVVANLADTDWYVHELYGMAPDLGITLVHARFSRYVIDLNRDPSGQSLYADGRRETGLVPLRTFAGQGIYAQQAPDTAEIARRLELYYRPYHAMLAKLLSELRAEFSHVLLFEAHSIRRQVTSIRPQPFPDLILGDQNGRTAAPVLIETALRELRREDRYQVSHNDPFMGGYITRRFGDPRTGVSTLQLEMAQDLYMDETTQERELTKQQSVQALLRPLLVSLAADVRQLSQ
jgi:N-formylglutamate amidohydrolase